MAADRIAAILKALASSKIDATVLSDDSSPCVVHQFVSTGSIVLDAIMGGQMVNGDITQYGGLPCGRVVEIYGDTSTGKSLLAAQCCATIQEQGGLAVYIDTETAVSLPIMEAVGVNTGTLVYLAPDTVEEVFKAMEAVVEAKEPDVPMLVVWDSIAATSSMAEMDKTTGEVGYMTHARIISQGLRKFTRQIAKSEVACLFLNQAKEALGVMFGDKVATFGGKAVGFHSSIRIMMSAGSKIKDGTKKSSRVIGIHARAKIVKNKVAPPFREAELPIYFGQGVDDDGALFLYLKNSEAIQSTGGGYYSMSGIDIPKFRLNDWASILDEHYDELQYMLYQVICEGDLV